MSNPCVRHCYDSGTPWEAEVGYSRAVRLGNWVWIAGTTAADDSGTLQAIGDPYGQARFILDKISRTLARSGASLQDVVRTRIYITESESWQAVGRAHGEVFGTIRPVSTMVVVKALVDPHMLVEIEVDAVIAHPV